MLKVIRLFIVVLFCSTGKLYSQDSLPRISVINRGGVTIVGWKNGYKKPVSTINIQRSYDSLKNYTTIGSVLNPQNTENGYADTKPPYRRMYYRVFISFEGGQYTFSEIRKPFREIQKNNNKLKDETDIEYNRRLFRIDSIERVEAIHRADSMQRALNPKAKLWMPSRNFYIGKDNNVIINLYDAGNKKYSAKFYENDSTFIFEVTKITEPYLIVDKVNFGHSGWFYFELYTNGILTETNRFFVPKDGKLTNSIGEGIRRNKP